jgi:hypothetical protein
VTPVTEREHLAALGAQSTPVRTVSDLTAEVVAILRARILNLPRGTVLCVTVGSGEQASRIRAGLLPHELDFVTFQWPGQVGVTTDARTGNSGRSAGAA